MVCSYPTNRRNFSGFGSKPGCNMCEGEFPDRGIDIWQQRIEEDPAHAL